MSVEMAEEGLISKDEALLRVDPSALDQLLHPTIDPMAEKDVLTRGLPASPGAACGQIVLSADKAEEMTAAGHQVILVRLETSPEDIHGMHAAAGILTARGGMTSHAAVVARGMGRPAWQALVICALMRLAVLFSSWIRAYPRAMSSPSMAAVARCITALLLPSSHACQKPFQQLWNGLTSAGVWRFAPMLKPQRMPARRLEFGAEGIGLCRTEHMFFDQDRIVAMRQMIMAADTKGREVALAKLLPMQRLDFEELFSIMAGLPVTIRLLDPPLHEFLPHSDEELADVAEAAGVSSETARQRALKLANPIRCSVIVDVGLPSPIRKYAGCKRAPFLRQLVLSRPRVQPRFLKSWCRWRPLEKRLRSARL